MTIKHFYYELVDLNALDPLLEKANINAAQRDHLLSIFHKTLHIEITKHVLDELPHEHRVTFITFLEEKPEDPGLKVFLERSIDDFEEKVRGVSAQVVNSFKNSLHDYLDASQEYLEGV